MRSVLVAGQIYHDAILGFVISLASHIIAILGLCCRLHAACILLINEYGNRTVREHFTTFSNSFKEYYVAVSRLTVLIKLLTIL